MGSQYMLNAAIVAAAPLAVGLVLWRRWYRLADVERRPAFSPATGIILFVAMYLAGIIGSGIVRRMIYGDGGPQTAAEMPVADLARVQIGSALGQVVVLAAYFWSGSGRPRASRSSGPAAVAAGAAAFALVWPITAGLSFATGLAASYLRGEPVAPIAHDTLLQMVDAPTDAWLFVMVGLLVAAVPVLEEIMYRGMLQRMLCALELSAWQAIALTSVIFAVMHVGAARWHALPALFVLSLGFGWAYERTGRLSAPIVMHMLFNAANLGLARLGTAAGG